MKNPWLVYAVVAVVSIGAGVAIAGRPATFSTDATIVAPSTTAAPVVTLPPATVPSTTAVPEPVTTDAPVESTTTVAETSTTSTSTTLPPIVKADVGVVAVNGAGVSGLASRTRDQLVDLGYSAARATDGSDIVDETAVFFFEGFEREAGEVALDLGIDPFRSRPMSEAPDFGLLSGDQVAVYIGRDRS